jgi:Tetratricopeptide repeat
MGLVTVPSRHPSRATRKNQVMEENRMKSERRADPLIQGHGGAFRNLGHDDNPDVANYVGYAYRRLGDYDVSKVWYDKALAADPNHVRTWKYYGLWYFEQGNKLKARDFLRKDRAPVWQPDLPGVCGPQGRNRGRTGQLLNGACRPPLN